MKETVFVFALPLFSGFRSETNKTRVLFKIIISFKKRSRPVSLSDRLLAVLTRDCSLSSFNEPRTRKRLKKLRFLIHRLVIVGESSSSSSSSFPCFC